jgi:cellulose synthase operon protein YhjQ
MMAHVVVASPKGGVGRTTVAAHLSAQLSARDRRCMAVDLDPQNALGLHLCGTQAAWIASQSTWPDANRRGVGFVQPDLTNTALIETLQMLRAQVAHVPFGAHDSAQRARAEADLARPDYLRQRLSALSPPRCDVLVIDTPAGGNAWSEAALALADLVLIPITPDPACFASLPAYERFLRAISPSLQERAFYVINQFDPSRALACDVVDALYGALPGRVVPSPVVEDELMREQLALGAPLALDASQAARDLGALADFVHTRLFDARPRSSVQAHAS